MATEQGTRANDRRTYALVVAGLVGGALLVAMLVVLILVLGELQSTRDNVAGTDAKLGRVIEASAPTAEEVPPLLDQANTLMLESLPGVRHASALLRPLADNGIDASVVLDQLPSLQRGLAGLVTDASVTARTASSVLEDAERQDLVGKAADAHRLLEGALEVQLATLRTQRASYRTQRASLQTQLRTARKLSRSLDLQRGALNHVRSIDDKTGGEFPPD